MSLVQVILAIAALLATPGPTNTLLALAAAERGAAQALRLIPAEVAGYLTIVVPLTFVGVPVLDAYPGLQPVVTVFAALWILWLAVGIWRAKVSRSDDAFVVTAGQIYVTTVLNPKALVFGLVILPSGPGLWVNLGSFVALVIISAAMWAAMGAALSHGGGGLPHWLRRAASLWLAVVAVLLLGRAVLV